MSIELYLLKGSSLICIRLLIDSSVYFYQKKSDQEKLMGINFLEHQHVLVKTR